MGNLQNCPGHLGGACWVGIQTHRVWFQRAQIHNSSQAMAGIRITWNLGITTKALSCFNRPLCLLALRWFWYQSLGTTATLLFCLDFECYSDATALPQGAFLSLQVSVSLLVPSGGETAGEPSRDPLSKGTLCLALEIPEFLSLVTWSLPRLSQESLETAFTPLPQTNLMASPCFHESIHSSISTPWCIVIYLFTDLSGGHHIVMSFICAVIVWRAANMSISF